MAPINTALRCFLLAAGINCLPVPSSALELLDIPSPASINSAQVHLSSNNSDGILVISWLEHQGGQAILRYSQWNDGQWGSAQSIVSGKDWFVNWADFPSVVPVSNDLWAAHWLHKRPGGTYAYDVAMSISTDGGQTWSDQITPHLDDTRTEHGFVSMFPWQGGVGALWLDGRNMLVEGQVEQPDKPMNETGMTLRSAVIQLNGEIADPQLVDGLVCECCQTDIALAADGPVAVYRNRADTETRDIYVVRSVEGRWQPGVAVSDDDWKIAGCPVNGPAISAREKQIAVAWFTGAEDQSRVRAAFSSDGGQTFGDAITLDDAEPMGRVDIEWITTDQAAVIWMCTRDKAAALCVRRVHSDGQTGTVHRLEGPVKPGGFPQMALSGQDLIFAWVESDEERTQVKTARLSALDLP